MIASLFDIVAVLCNFSLLQVIFTDRLRRCNQFTLFYSLRISLREYSIDIQIRRAGIEAWVSFACLDLCYQFFSRVILIKSVFIA